jgi:hypothetical protein
MRCDYVIVGGGSAGCCLANRLSEDRSTSVVVLEAGRPDYLWDVYIHMPAALSFPIGNRFYNWKYESEPEPFMHSRSGVLMATAPSTDRRAFKRRGCRAGAPRSSVPRELARQWEDVVRPTSVSQISAGGRIRCANCLVKLYRPIAPPHGEREQLSGRDRASQNYRETGQHRQHQARRRSHSPRRPSHRSEPGALMT